MRPVARILLIILALLILGVWVLAAVAASDYEEITALYLGVLWLLTAFVLTWNARRRWLKFALLFVLLAVIFVFGLLAREAGEYRTRVRIITAHNILDEIARAIEHRQSSAPSLINCDWPCLTQALQQSGDWRGFGIPYEGREGDAVRVETIPRKDPWGCKFVYEPSATGGFTLKSSGPDRRWETADDLIVTDRSPLPALPQPLPVFHPFQRPATH
jgi:hypothetical protein